MSQAITILIIYPDQHPVSTRIHDTRVRRISLYGYQNSLRRLRGNILHAVICTQGVTLEDLEKHPASYLALKNCLITTQGVITIDTVNGLVADNYTDDIDEVYSNT